MKRFTLILASIIICAASQAQDKNPVVPPPVPSWVSDLAGNLFAAKAASFSVSPSLQGGKTGFCLAVLYPVSEYAFTGIRLDYFDGGFTAPSAVVGAKYTLKQVRFQPTVFTVGGLVMAVGGANEENHVVAATTGIGASAVLWKSKDGHFSLNAFIEAEKWTNFTEPVIHPGLILAGSF